MKLTSTEEYGLRCLLQLARRAGSGPVPVSTIAAAEGISDDNAAKLLRMLRKGHLVVSTRGANGGYELARPADAITVWDALTVLGGRVYEGDAFCTALSGAQEVCTHTSACSLRPLWQWVDDALEAALSRVTLSDCLSSAAMTRARMHGLLPEAPTVEAR